MTRPHFRIVVQEPEKVQKHVVRNDRLEVVLEDGTTLDLSAECSEINLLRKVGCPAMVQIVAFVSDVQVEHGAQPTDSEGTQT